MSIGPGAVGHHLDRQFADSEIRPERDACLDEGATDALAASLGRDDEAEVSDMVAPTRLRRDRDQSDELVIDECTEPPSRRGLRPTGDRHLVQQGAVEEPALVGRYPAGEGCRPARGDRTSAA